jgi:CRISPR/Cas system CSM-associated protein Csm3 (group 7 of RAMP superfamily)
MEIKNSVHTHRYISRFIMEAETPLFVGSGESSLLKDALVFKDVNGFPMIPGTSIAGVLRHAFDNKNVDDNWQSIFGINDTKGIASRLYVSSALMMLNESRCSEGILNESELDKATLSRFTSLPSRQHVRINDKGVAIKNGLFDNEIVYKGTRFIFEIGLRGTDNDSLKWDELLHYINNSTFRLGSGTRNGYGSLKVLSAFERKFDLRDKGAFSEFLDFNPSLNASLVWNTVKENTTINESFLHYELKLKPDYFFIFSEGFGDDDVDNRPLEEEVVTYAVNDINFEKQTVIPASSIKGAIAHRTAFHYNKKTGKYSNEKTTTELMEIAKSNIAVVELFGAQAGVENARAGNVFLNDLYLDKTKVNNNQIFNHVAIDRFTGGAMKGALFNEKVSRLTDDSEIKLSIYVKKEKNAKESDYSENVIDAFQETLKDICKGLLPLGGMTTKGNGMFTGILSIDGIEEFNYKKQVEECHK